MKQKTSSKPASNLPQWPRVALVALLGTLCVLVIAKSPQFAGWREQWSVKLKQPLIGLPQTWRPNPISTRAEAPKLDDALLLSDIAEIRTQNKLAALQENDTLHKLARLVAITAEGDQSVAVPAETESLLRALTPNPPRNAAATLIFAPDTQAVPDLTPDLASNSAILKSVSTQVGVATRSATFDGVHGILVVAVVSSDFPARVPTPAPVTQIRITFTGQDLWTAVQNYRQAHALPAFELATELCTVASIRVNDLLQLGKLDDHTGFKPQSDAFFVRNPGWTGINENIAAGYQTAVQTVEWGWDQSLGHQALIQSREFPKACAAANSGFAVLITGK